MSPFSGRWHPVLFGRTTFSSQQYDGTVNQNALVSAYQEQPSTYSPFKLSS